MAVEDSRSQAAPPLFGLVLAGGKSERMGTDKGLLRLRNDQPQVQWLHGQLAEVCDSVYVSVSARQQTVAPYSSLPLIVDEVPDAGPAAALLSAWNRHDSVAWVVVAVDMPLVDSSVLADLVSRRRPDRLATAFRNEDGLLEPLCAIWEPAGREVLRARVEAGDASLKRMLEAQNIRSARPRSRQSLISINTPADMARIKGSL